MSSRDKYSELIIWSGVILGVADWISDMIYASNSEFANPLISYLCLAFVVI